jgi:hypothetical protein
MKQHQRLEPTPLNEEDDEEEEQDQIMDLQDKVDNVLEKEEELIASHMQLIKENAQILTQEGELISYVQETDDYDIEYYVDRVAKVASRKLQIYMKLRDKINEFKKTLKEEEEMHRATLAKKKNGLRLNNPPGGYHKENR